MRIPLGVLSIRKEPAERDGGRRTPVPINGKRGRDVFLYFHDGRDYPGEFGQCNSCQMWVLGQDLCAILGPIVEATAGSSCGVYVPGMPSAGSSKEVLTPEEVGFVKDQPVRCQNCFAFDFERSRCEFFEALNERMPDVFDCDPNVVKGGCCDAFSPAANRPQVV